MKKRSALIFGLPAILLAFSLVLAGCDDPSGGGSNPNGPPSTPSPFTITGHDSYQVLVTVTTQNPSTLSQWSSLVGTPANIKGQGIKAAGTSTVSWVTAPPNGTYTIIILYSNLDTFSSYEKATNVTITNGGGSASSFTTLS